MSAPKWFYVQDDKRVGPVDVDHIVHLVVTTVLAPSTLVWHNGLSEWTEAERVPEIIALLPPPLPPGKKAGLVEPPPLPVRAAPAAERAGKAGDSAAPAHPAATAAAPAPAANPRIEELKHKLEKDPSPRAFGLLAEELRKTGDFAEAIRVSREGVERSPSYPSLRVTLGRALLESGDLPAARAELETVVQAAPDNILAERFLGECLEALGERGRARAQYLKALALAPGDPQLVARLRSLHGGDAPGPSPGNGSASPGPSDAPAVSPEGAAVTVDSDPLAGMLDDTGSGSHALEPPSMPALIMEEPPPPSAPEPPPIKLVAAEGTFEIERANDIAAGTAPSRSGSGSKKKPAGEERGAKSSGTEKTSPPPASAPSVIIDFEEDPPSDPLALAPAVSGGPSAIPPAPPPVVPPAPAPPAKAAAAPPPSAPAKGRPSGERASAPPATVAPAPTSPAPTDVKASSALVPETPIAWPSGRVADHEFADLVREVYSRRWSGLLTLNHMGVEKSVRVQEGRLVFAFSSSRDDRLGELLLRRGRITLHQYVEASRAMRKGIRLGTVLVEQGALDPRELVKAVMDHTQEIIYSAFQWTEGLYHFTEGGEASEPIMLKLSTPDVILEGIRRIDLWSRIERAVGSLETRYLRARGYEKVLGEMTLSLEKLSILTGLEMEQDLGTICRNSTLSHFEVCRTLWAYRVIGVVQRLA